MPYHIECHLAIQSSTRIFRGGQSVTFERDNTGILWLDLQLSRMGEWHFRDNNRTQLNRRKSMTGRLEKVNWDLWPSAEKPLKTIQLGIHSSFSFIHNPTKLNGGFMFDSKNFLFTTFTFLFRFYKLIWLKMHIALDFRL